MSQQNEDLKSLLNLADQNEREFAESVEKGFQPLYDYIVKNVYNDAAADLPRLYQLHRNISGWLLQVKDKYLDPEWKNKAESFIGYCNATLEALQKRIDEKL